MCKWEEAIPSFQEAERLSPQESIYPANLGEIFWKLGDKTSVNRYAKKTKSLGNKSEIVETIFRETKKNS
ncbi:tetratricopeptide repeat protein [Leptospira noguchii]|uniref:Tetratricopeptide repeat protein n=1 Tax=Leptospira noguchii TaxID=28182 RepID=M6VDF6_9LEPT|nr:tetratricopeptide repeat protein [Leptospira noguchii]